jgi:hypothetical protein
MKIEYFFIIGYLILAFWQFPKIHFIRNSKLTNKEIRLLLGFKITTAVICSFYFEEISNATDYLAYNDEGKLEYKLLLSSPLTFVTNITNDLKIYGTGGLFSSSLSFWAYLKSNLLFKFIAILNLLSHGNFYFNTVIFSTLVFFGHIAFYRIFSDIYKGQKTIILVACFCIPSLLMYTSCIHKDGIIFLCLGVICYIFYKFLSQNKRPGFKYSFYFLLSLVTIFLFRNYVIVAILPAMLTAILCKTFTLKRRFTVLTTYAIFLLLFFVSGVNESLLNLPDAVVQRKADFAVLVIGNTSIEMNDLQPTFLSFAENLPRAINHYFFRPYMWEFSQTAIFFTAIELLVYQLIILAFIFYRKKQPLVVNNFNIFGLAFIFNMMLIIGYTIPNIGAIVRYRSIFWVFLLCPALCNIDWKKLFKTKIA